jgi:hypothetical protein
MLAAYSMASSSSHAPRYGSKCRFIYGCMMALAANPDQGAEIGFAAGDSTLRLKI